MLRQSVSVLNLVRCRRESTQSTSIHLIGCRNNVTSGFKPSHCPQPCPWFLCYAPEAVKSRETLPPEVVAIWVSHPSNRKCEQVTFLTCTLDISFQEEPSSCALGPDIWSWALGSSILPLALTPCSSVLAPPAITVLHSLMTLRIVFILWEGISRKVIAVLSQNLYSHDLDYKLLLGNGWP